MARSFSARLFLEVKSPSDFYLSTLLNSFIALVQQPVSFAFYIEQNEKIDLLFHYCSDKEHIGWFVKSIPKNTLSKQKQNLFPFFPSILGNSRYFISLHWMHTKTLLGGRESTTISVTEHEDPSSKARYIRKCAENFFSKPWDGFNTDFRLTVKACLEESIRRIEANDRNARKCDISAAWPPTFDDLRSAYRTTKHPNNDKENWHGVVSDIFIQTIQNLDFGNRAIASLTHKSNGESEGDTLEPRFPQNMLLMYRSFDRDDPDSETGMPDCGRHANSNGAYSYNIRFLLDDPDDRTKSIRSYLGNLKQAFLEGEERFEKSEYAVVFRNRYANILDSITHKQIELRGCSIVTDALKMLAVGLDIFFWKMLSEEEGLEECLNLFKTPVGNNTRGMGDPVISTGLVHSNNIFSYGGFDRIDLREIVSRQEDLASLYQDFKIGLLPESEANLRFLEIWETNPSIAKDLKRIVVFYYIFLGMALEGSSSAKDVLLDDTKKLTAILMPIKMRGAVWGVTVHASLLDIDDPKKSFNNNTIWLSTFYLMTSQAQRYRNLVDNILWDNAERRVIELMANYIGGDDGTDWDRALTKVNEKLEGEQRLVPYVFPTFRTNVSPDYQPKRGQFLDLLQYEPTTQVDENLHRVFQIVWEIGDNPFFVARQRWDGHYSRSFKQAVELGWHQGLRQQASRMLQNNSGQESEGDNAS